MVVVCRSTILASALVVLGGCSYMALDRAPRAMLAGDSHPECVKESAWPTVDVGWAVLTTVMAVYIYAAGTVKTDSEPPMRRPLTTNEKAVFGTATLAHAAMFALSARHGYRQLARCRGSQATYQPRPIDLSDPPEPAPHTPRPPPAAPSQPEPAQGSAAR